METEVDKDAHPELDTLGDAQSIEFAKQRGYVL